MTARSAICSTCKHRETCETCEAQRAEIPTCWESDGSDTATKLLRGLDEKPDGSGQTEPLKRAPSTAR